MLDCNECPIADISTYVLKAPNRNLYVSSDSELTNKRKRVQVFLGSDIKKMKEKELKDFVIIPFYCEM